MVVGELTGDPLAPDDVVSVGFRNEVLQSAAEESTVVISTDVIDSLGDEILVLFDQIYRFKMSFEQVFCNSSNASSAIHSSTFSGTFFLLKSVQRICSN